MITASGEILFGLFLILLIRGLVSAHRRDDTAWVAAPDSDPGPDGLPEPVRPVQAPPPAYALPGPLPLRARAAARWRRTALARDPAEGEWLLDFDEPGTYRVTLPMPRRVVRLEMLFACDEPLPVIDVVVAAAGGRTVPWSGRWLRRDGKMCLRLDFSGADRLTAVTMPTRLDEVVDCDLSLRLIATGEPDAPFLEAAEAARNRGDAAAFRHNLEEYEKICPTNPVSALHLANMHVLAGEDEQAEIHALRAMGLERVPPALEICRALARRRPWQLEPEHLRRLQDEVAAWGLEGHHGLVVLMQERAYRMGPGGYVRERFHAAYLVRRHAAARKFRSLSVPFGAGAGGLIHTRAQVRRADGTCAVLDDDRFTVGSAEDDNPFIAIARKRTGIWILNDLVPGDVVEFTWDVVRLGKDQKGNHDLFVLANITDTDTPTLHGQVSFSAPPDWDLAFAVRNTEPGRTESSEPATGWNTTVFTRERVLPRRSHSLPYQHTALNPLVACARRGPDWDTVGDAILQSSREAVAGTAAPPAPLNAACAGLDDPRAALARAFYWVRDRIKYASIASANRDLGSPGRAERIVAAGMGDCKDAALLLAVFCAARDIPWEFVLMSAEHGILLEELPADQFDHMIVRARLDDEWLYLDAAGDAAVFGAPPFPFQGVTVLTGREGGILVTIGETPTERTGVVIRERIDGIDGSRLAGGVELRLEGHPARMVDEVWKHQSLMSLDPERAADEAIRHLLPDFEITSSERLSGTTGSDVLHVTARGRRGRLVPLDGHRIVALSFGAPGLPVLARRQKKFSERFAFLLKAEFEYHLEVTGEARRVLRGISAVADVAAPFATISEERREDGDRSGVVRRIHLTKRVVEGEDLAALPGVLERIEEATHVVVALAGEERAFGD